eukprot:TRINITY_DN25920_c0_g1_i5.p1 TRINITY_DN25920_c0_g1~~TRINITY_DN25920_c0_g1_i5.p1  ORF type:complete len:337 (+),score=43.68 TRINITY_DN25920_c0_g1_i5:75-1085(+)
MDAARLCQAASRRLGFHMRRSSVAHSRRELRAAQRAVDSSRLVLLAAAQLQAAKRSERQLEDLLGALALNASAATRCATHQCDAGSQTDHRLHKHVHALACSKGTDNPTDDLVDPFELRLLVTGPELDNSANVVSCASPAIRSIIKVKGMNLCYGELYWTSRQLYAGRTVECKLSTAEVLAMSKRIFAARGISDMHTAEKSSAKDWDDSCSEASTTAASSLSCPTTSTELSGSDGEQPSRRRASQEALSHRRLARARRSTRGLPTYSKSEANSASPTCVEHKSLPTVAEEERDKPLVLTETLMTLEDFETLHDLLQSTRLKTYVFTHNLEWYIRPP